MTNTRSTKRALISSVMALLLCFAMLLGSTFAWFTDSVTSANNIIQSGTLDVQLLMYNGTEYVDISESEKPIFGENGLISDWEDVDFLWEPGKTQIVYLGVKNAGSLALKYNVLVDVEDKGLVGALDYAIIDGATKDAADALAIASWSDLLSVNGVQSGLIEAGRTVAAENGALESDACDYFALAVHMNEEAGNEYKDKSIVVDISIMATQLSSEGDSFGADYDAALDPTKTYVSDMEDLWNASFNGGSIALNNDVEVSNKFSANRAFAVKSGVELILDLNGKEMDYTGYYQNGKNDGYTYLYTTAYNGKLVINGEGTVKSHNSEGRTCIAYAQGPSEIIVNSGNYEVDNGIAMWAGNNAKITINGGSFVSTNGNNEELIYSSGGVIDIYGGFFHNTTWEGRPVNVANANRGTGFINIYGGTFVNFDPSTGGDDPNNIKVADGYIVTSEAQANGDVWYTVVPVPAGYEKAVSAEDVADALASGKDVVLAEDIVINETLNVTVPTNIDLNGKTLTVSRMEANSTLTVNGGTLVNGEATYPAISVNDGGKLVLNDVKVVGGTPCNVITSGSAQAAEIVGVQVFGGECVLNNCDIELDVTELRYSNSVFAIGIHDGSFTMNGGSVTVKSVGSTRGEYDYQSAIFAGGNTDKTVTLNNVDVEAKNFLYAWGGTTTVNTTADDGSYTGFDARNGGTYTINYNYDN